MTYPPIRPARAEDEQAWRVLWRGYLEFYLTALPAEITDHTWARILDPDSPVECLVAEHGGRLVGFAIHLVHENTWSLSPICYLEDLYVVPELRGGGVGRALIEAVRALALSRGQARLYWHANIDNAVARLLYDKVAGAAPKVVYEIPLAVASLLTANGND